MVNLLRHITTMQNPSQVKQACDGWRLRAAIQRSHRAQLALRPPSRSRARTCHLRTGKFCISPKWLCPEDDLRSPPRFIFTPRAKHREQYQRVCFRGHVAAENSTPASRCRIRNRTFRSMSLRPSRLRSRRLLTRSLKPSSSSADPTSNPPCRACSPPCSIRRFEAVAGKRMREIAPTWARLSKGG